LLALLTNVNPCPGKKFLECGMITKKLASQCFGLWVSILVRSRAVSIIQEKVDEERSLGKKRFIPGPPGVHRADDCTRFGVVNQQGRGHLLEKNKIVARGAHG